MNISGLIQIISTALSAIRIPLAPLPGLLLFCTASRRLGFSSILASAKVYADMNYVSEDNDEIVKKFTFNLINRIKLNIQDDSVCFIAIPPNELRLQLIGGNAGGPITLDGANKNYVFAWAIIR